MHKVKPLVTVLVGLFIAVSTTTIADAIKPAPPVAPRAPAPAAQPTNTIAPVAIAPTAPQAPSAAPLAPSPVAPVTAPRQHAPESDTLL